MIFMGKKILFEYKIGLILINLNQTFPMKPSEFKISILVESYDEKTAENYRNRYVAEKRIVSKLSKISIPNFNSTNWRLKYKFCYNFTFLSIELFEKKAMRHGLVGPVHRFK